MKNWIENYIDKIKNSKRLKEEWKEKPRFQSFLKREEIEKEERKDPTLDE